MNFHEKFRLLRTELGLTQEQASAKMGIAISSIRNYEKDRLPDSQQLKRIKEFYKVPYEYLLNDECNTREEDNLKIGEKLGISDKSIVIIKELSSNKNIEELEKLLEYVYDKNILVKMEEYRKINYIIEIFFNNFCPKIEKAFIDKKYNSISDEQLKAIEAFIKYHNEIKEQRSSIEEQKYLESLQNKDYINFVDSLIYIEQAFNYKSNINEYELTNFYNYKKVKNIFMNYKTYFITNLLIHINDEYIKSLNNFKI